MANAALRVVGRLDLAEAERPEYGFLAAHGRARAGILKPGTMIVQQPEIPTALLLCIVSSFAAAGVSGVAGGSLLLIPMACALFGIQADVAMQVVAIGFVISVV